MLNTYFSDSEIMFKLCKHLLEMCVYAQQESEVPRETVRNLTALALDTLELYEMTKKDE